MIDQIRKEDVMLREGQMGRGLDTEQDGTHGDAETEEDGRFRLMWT